jgi:hypothetical protein
MVLVYGLIVSKKKAIELGGSLLAVGVLLQIIGGS